MDTTALLNIVGVAGLGAFVVVAASWLERSLRGRQPIPARDLLVRPDGQHETTPAEAFQHAEGASAWTR
ncbi:hypothetical protein SAMN06264364_111103 [Quadrisphaera granulorum]|uniref:Uncharacterized protein n=1 Tax=Quadrisphaera granulorum TaxID=317664 RepID=A0A316A9M8_9ACTN|nr:hypothetical protein [Quadrisphaera granulorum]PWJ53700.1 hypothetical protein BXY45_111103 [Quadrisphaera granulorum]SZE96744.1 hypothetical protein SAMN06264364_111103 [Quadrisphaera granulorum]